MPLSIQLFIHRILSGININVDFALGQANVFQLNLIMFYGKSLPL